MATIVWQDDDEFTVDDVVYRSMVGRTDSDQMVVLKPRSAVEAYVELIDQAQPRTILELGIYNGGSAALFAQLARPTKSSSSTSAESCSPSSTSSTSTTCAAPWSPTTGSTRPTRISSTRSWRPSSTDRSTSSSTMPRTSCGRRAPASTGCFPTSGTAGCTSWRTGRGPTPSRHPDPGYQDVPSMSPFVFELTSWRGDCPRVIPELSIDSFKADGATRTSRPPT